MTSGSRSSGTGGTCAAARARRGPRGRAARRPGRSRAAPSHGSVSRSDRHSPRSMVRSPARCAACTWISTGPCSAPARRCCAAPTAGSRSRRARARGVLAGGRRGRAVFGAAAGERVRERAADRLVVVHLRARVRARDRRRARVADRRRRALARGRLDLSTRSRRRARRRCCSSASRGGSSTTRHGRVGREVSHLFRGSVDLDEVGSVLWRTRASTGCASSTTASCARTPSRCPGCRSSTPTT